MHVIAHEVVASCENSVETIQGRVQFCRCDHAGGAHCHLRLVLDWQDGLLAFVQFSGLVRVSISISTPLYVYVHVCICIYIYIYIYVLIDCAHNMSICHICIYTRVCKHMHVYVACTYVCIYAHAHTHTHIYIYIYTHIYIVSTIAVYYS